MSADNRRQRHLIVVEIQFVAAVQADTYGSCHKPRQTSRAQGSRRACCAVPATPVRRQKNIPSPPGLSVAARSGPAAGANVAASRGLNPPMFRQPIRAVQVQPAQVRSLQQGRSGFHVVDAIPSERSKPSSYRTLASGSTEIYRPLFVGWSEVLWGCGLIRRALPRRTLGLHQTGPGNQSQNGKGGNTKLKILLEGASLNSLQDHADGRQRSTLEIFPGSQVRRETLPFGLWRSSNDSVTLGD